MSSSSDNRSFSSVLRLGGHRSLNQGLAFPENPTKLQLSEHLSHDMGAKFGTNNNDWYTYTEPKEGGANRPGKLGGVYSVEYSVDGVPKIQKILFKQDTGKDGKINHDKNIGEFVAGRMMNKLIGDSSASIFFATAPSSKPLKIPDETGENIYIGSVFYDGYKDLFKQLYEAQGKEVPADRPKGVGILPGRTQVLREGMLQDGKCPYKDFEPVTAASVLMGDPDVHWSNYGVVNGERLVKIDHGAALAHLTDDLHIHSHLAHTPITIEEGRIVTRPTNHFREYPRALRVSPAFATELDRIAAIDLTSTINDSIDEAARYYGAKPLFDFAKRTGVDLTVFGPIDWDNIIPEEKAQLKERIVKETKKYLTEKMKRRQESAKQLSLEIKLSHCFEVKNGKPVLKEDSYILADLIKAHPSYFLQGKFHFRKSDQRSKFGPIKLKIFKRHALTQIVNKQLALQTQEILNIAIKNKDIHLLEQMLMNKTIQKEFKKNRELKEEIQNQYKELLQHELEKLKTANDLRDVIKREMLAQKSRKNKMMIARRYMSMLDFGLSKLDKATANKIKQGLREGGIEELFDTKKTVFRSSEEKKLFAQFQNHFQKKPEKSLQSYEFLFSKWNEKIANKAPNPPPLRKPVGTHQGNPSFNIKTDTSFSYERGISPPKSAEKNAKPLPRLKGDESNLSFNQKINFFEGLIKSQSHKNDDRFSKPKTNPPEKKSRKV